LVAVDWGEARFLAHRHPGFPVSAEPAARFPDLLNFLKKK
jgi:hypothetical protein